MYKLEELGYFEYFKLEYSNLSTTDCVIYSYQKTINEITDYFRQSVTANLPQDQLDKRIKVIASTDVLEFLHRKKMPLVIFRFSMLSNLGIENFKELCNELHFPRSDRTRDCARDVLKYFPADWAGLVTDNNVSGEIEPESFFYNRSGDLVDNRYVFVKDIRKILINRSELNPRPFENIAKFELNLTMPHNENPFLLARNCLHAPRDKILKYRVLYGDIFCRSRMFKFKMVDSPNCTYCINQIETVKHLIWDCPRSRNVWNQVNDWFRPVIGIDYINYETIVLGGQKPLGALETIIVWVLRTIMSIDRENMIPNEVITAKIKSLFIYEKKVFGKASKKLSARWAKLIDVFEDDLQ